MDPEVLEALRRHSHIALTADGTWRFHDAEVPNPRVQALFHRGVAVRDDGEVTLTVGHQWCYVTCETVARFVDGLRASTDGLVLRYRDGASAVASRPIVATGPDERFYVWADEDADVALLTRTAASQLVAFVEEHDGAAVVRLGGERLPIVTLDAIPRPDARPPG